MLQALSPTTAVWRTYPRSPARRPSQQLAKAMGTEMRGCGLHQALPRPKHVLGALPALEALRRSHGWTFRSREQTWAAQAAEEMFRRRMQRESDSVCASILLAAPAEVSQNWRPGAGRSEESAARIWVHQLGRLSARRTIRETRTPGRDGKCAGTHALSQRERQERHPSRQPARESRALGEVATCWAASRGLDRLGAGDS